MNPTKKHSSDFMNIQISSGNFLDCKSNYATSNTEIEIRRGSFQIGTIVSLILLYSCCIDSKNESNGQITGIWHTQIMLEYVRKGQKDSTIWD